MKNVFSILFLCQFLLSASLSSAEDEKLDYSALHKLAINDSISKSSKEGNLWPNGNVPYVLRVADQHSWQRSDPIYLVPSFHQPTDEELRVVEEFDEKGGFKQFKEMNENAIKYVTNYTCIKMTQLERLDKETYQLLFEVGYTLQCDRYRMRTEVNSYGYRNDTNLYDNYNYPPDLKSRILYKDGEKDTANSFQVVRSGTPLQNITCNSAKHVMNMFMRGLGLNNAKVIKINETLVKLADYSLFYLNYIYCCLHDAAYRGWKQTKCNEFMAGERRFDIAHTQRLHKNAVDDLRSRAARK